MVWFILKNILLSILFIYCIHSLWNYILQVCTTKKKKDLVKIQENKYASILNTIIQSSEPEDDYNQICMSAEEMKSYTLSLMNEEDANENIEIPLLNNT
jgi:hypothetical protein